MRSYGAACCKRHQITIGTTNSSMLGKKYKKHSPNGDLSIRESDNNHRMDVSENSGTPKSSILIGFSIIFSIHFGGNTPIFGNTRIFTNKSHGFNQISLPNTEDWIPQKTACKKTKPELFGRLTWMSCWK